MRSVIVGMILIVVTPLLLVILAHNGLNYVTIGSTAVGPNNVTLIVWGILLIWGLVGLLTVFWDRRRSQVPLEKPPQPTTIQRIEEAIHQEPEVQSTVTETRLPAKEEVSQPNALSAYFARQAEYDSKKRAEAVKRIHWSLPTLSQILDDNNIVPDQDFADYAGQTVQYLLRSCGLQVSYLRADTTSTECTYYLVRSHETNPDGPEKEPTPQRTVSHDQVIGTLSRLFDVPKVRLIFAETDKGDIAVTVRYRDNRPSLATLMKSLPHAVNNNTLLVALGEREDHEPQHIDIAALPHLLIGGATGSGKSVCLNSILTSLLLTHTPETLKLILVDFRFVNLGQFAGLPHLLSPIIDKPNSIEGVMLWLRVTIKDRLRRFCQVNVRGIGDFNSVMRLTRNKLLPHIVVVLDEFSDLSLYPHDRAADELCYIAETGRAAGVHLILATNGLSRMVMPRRLLQNIPARLAFRVPTRQHSDLVLDMYGAELLSEHGVALLKTANHSDLIKVRIPMVTDGEISRLVTYWKAALESAKAGT